MPIPICAAVTVTSGWMVNPSTVTLSASMKNPINAPRNPAPYATIASWVGSGKKGAWHSVACPCRRGACRNNPALLTWTDSLYSPGQTRIVAPGRAAAMAALMLVNCAFGHCNLSSSTMSMAGSSTSTGTVSSDPAVRRSASVTATSGSVRSTPVRSCTMFVCPPQATRTIAATANHLESISSSAAFELTNPNLPVPLRHGGASPTDNHPAVACESVMAWCPLIRRCGFGRHPTPAPGAPKLDVPGPRGLVEHGMMIRASINASLARPSDQNSGAAVDAKSAYKFNFRWTTAAAAGRWPGDYRECCLQRRVHLPTLGRAAVAVSGARVAVERLCRGAPDTRECSRAQGDRRHERRVRGYQRARRRELWRLQRRRAGGDRCHNRSREAG